jgi:diguanylate cyclase (GGDEF)-like protein
MRDASPTLSAGEVTSSAGEATSSAVEVALAKPMSTRLADHWTRDLRPPIALIGQHVSWLQSSEGALSDAQRQSVLAIEEQAQHLDRLVKTLEGFEPPSEVLSRLQASGSGTPSPAVLIADDDNDILEALGDLLSGLYRLTFARNGDEAMTALCLWSFDLAIIDLGLPIVDGFKLVKAIRGSEDLQSPAVLFLTGQSDPRAKVRALALGAVDYVTKPFDSGELVARVARILATAARETTLRVDAMTDPLTGLANYRAFSQSLARELERSRRYKLPISLIIVDLDHLKVINDAHGHDAGNEAIRLTARLLTGAVRKFEVVARQGGDEFAVILPNTGPSDARRLADRLHGLIGGESVRGVRLSASLGVASQNKTSLDAAALIKAGDKALYRAKGAGRDRVEVDTAP